MSHNRSLAEPAFPDDDGSLDDVLATAFAEFASHDEPAAIIGALCSVRVFVAVIALLGEIPSDGDKDSEMAAVFMTGADGRKALLAFSSLDSMKSWDPQARPVPVYGYDAARAALDEGATALLLDLGGPHFVVVETYDLEHLAAGDQLVNTEAGTAWVTS
ncbi:MAG: SseB family protein [Kineosporiaceae bacterium]|nr:SseB family protein [Aeromicrobium sp.]